MEGKLEQSGEKGGNQVLWWVLGCGLAFLLGVTVICGGAVFMGWRFVDQTLPTLAAEAIEQGVRESRLPDEDQQAIISEVQRVTQAYKDDRIGLEDLGGLMETLAEDGVFHVGLIHALRDSVRDHTGLSAEEKLAAETTLTRAEYGVWNGLIPVSRIEDDLDLRIESQGDGFNIENADWSWDDPSEMRRILEGLAEEVEAANVPLDATPIDLGGELAQRVDEALGLE